MQHVYAKLTTVNLIC